MFTSMCSIGNILICQNCMGWLFVLFMDFLGDSVACVRFGTKKNTVKF